MAKRRKKTTHRKTYRRRRVSGIKDVDFTVIALTIGGAVAGRILSTKLAASTNTTMQKLAPYSAVALGIILPMITKQPMIKALSLGMVAGGGVVLLGPTGLKVISGMDRVGYPYNNVLPYKRVAGIEPAGSYGLPPSVTVRPNVVRPASGSTKPPLHVISGTEASSNHVALIN